MTENQHTERDPTQQYHQLDQQSEQELEHPGIESEMQPEPDYGYKPTAVAAGSTARRPSSPARAASTTGWRCTWW
jgi:hypothetical protein